MRPAIRRTSGRLTIRALLILLTIVPSTALVVLAGLVVADRYVEVRNLTDHHQMASNAGPAGSFVVVQLQQERRLSAALLGASAGPRPVPEELRLQRERTDAAVRTFHTFVDGVDNSARRVLDSAHRVQADLAGLGAQRTGIDQRSAGQAELLQPYSTQIDHIIQMFQALSRTVEDGEITYTGQSLVNMFRVGEALAHEDTLFSYAVGTGTFGTAEYREFVRVAGVRRALFSEQIVPYLSPSHRALFDTMSTSRAWQSMEQIEDAVTDARPTGKRDIPLPSNAPGWRPAVDELNGSLNQFAMANTMEVVAFGNGRIDDRKTELAWLAGIGLLGVVAAVFATWRISRAVRRRLTRLQLETAEHGRRLPDIVERLSLGQAVDLDTEMPPAAAEDDEVGQVAAAFDEAQRTAVAGAVRLAREREGFARVFLNVALRSQSLVGRQLGELDRMERAHQDPVVLKDLFVLDHLATRLRRYEENLVILSGNQPGRRWSRPVRVVDVLRSAVGEVEDYTRVEVAAAESYTLVGPAVGGVVHLLAELIENAVVFSPPGTPVQVRAVPVAKGMVVEIEDRGLGVAEAECEALNERLAHPVPFDVVALGDDVRLGLFVVARLAEQHNLKVTLRPSPYGGTMAIVFLPDALIADERGSDTGELPAVVQPQPEPVRLVRARRPEPVPLRAAPPARELVRAREPVPSESDDPAGEKTDGVRRALPRRVRQAGLVEQLRAPAAAPDEGTASEPAPRAPTSAAATLSAFRRGTEAARRPGTEPAAPREHPADTPGDQP